MINLFLTKIVKDFIIYIFKNKEKKNLLAN